MPQSNPRLPVLIGVGQFSNRVDEGDDPLEPVALMAEAARRAATDAGSPAALGSLDSVRVVCELSWRYRNPGLAVAEHLGVSIPESVVTVMGGNYVQTLLNRTARDIADGRNDLVLLTGGEAWRTRSQAKRLGDELAWTTQDDDVTPATPFGDDESLVGPAELSAGIVMPVQVYPMLDIALRAAERIGIDEHRQRIGRLWSRFSEIAASNPHAWIRRPMSVEAIIEPSADNRMIGFPYTKVLNSNNMVDQGAALIVCSAERAESLGVPRDRWVFLHSGADAHDHWFVSNRADLHSSPAMRFAGAATLELAGVGVDDLAFVDLYSCFPSAVQIAARELGFGLDRDLTVTGGMSFAGGPWNNYVMHSVATMVTRLREAPGTLGLCSANGGYITKHAFGTYGTDPPAAGAFRWEDRQADVDATPSREVSPDHTGTASIEAYTVTHDRSGAPERALAALLTPAGARCWASSTEADVMAELLTTEGVGRQVDRRSEGTFAFA